MNETLFYAMMLSTFLGAIVGVLWLIKNRLTEILLVLYTINGKQAWEREKRGE